MKSRIKSVATAVGARGGRGKGRIFKLKEAKKLFGPASSLISILVILILAGTVQARKGQGERDRDRTAGAERTPVVEIAAQPLTQHESADVSGSGSSSLISSGSSASSGAGAGQQGQGILTSGGSGSGGVYSQMYDPYGYGSAKYSSSAAVYPQPASTSASSYQQALLNYYSAYGYPSGQSQSQSQNQPSISSSSSSNGVLNVHAGNNPYNYYSSHGQSGQASYHSPYYSRSSVIGEPQWPERTEKSFATRTSNNIPVSASGSNNNYAHESAGQDDSNEWGMQAVASNHKDDGGHSGGGYGHGHGGGGGWGWKGASYGGGGNNYDSSALGVLGLIGVLFLLQTVLVTISTTTTTTTVVGRKKRDIVGDMDYYGDEKTDTTHEESVHNRVERILLMVLPSLNVIAHARDGRVPMDCSQRQICVANQLLVKELGTQGRSVGSILSSAVTKLFKEADTTGAIGKDLDKASLAGRRGDDCHAIYPVCSALQKQGEYSLPLLVQPHELANHPLLHPTSSQNPNQTPPPPLSPPSQKLHLLKKTKKMNSQTITGTGTSGSPADAQKTKV